MEFIKEDYVLGDKKIIVGDHLHNLVLESLGKIWIRYGSGYKEFSEFLNTVLKSASSAGALVIEKSGTKTPDAYKDGQLVFDARKLILYIKYANELLLLLECSREASEKYVYKTGDTMTGLLVINVKNQAPLKVNSAELVENLNVEYFLDKTPDDFAQQIKDETIKGNWVFDGKNTFNKSNTFNKDVTIKGDLTVDAKSTFNEEAMFNKDVSFQKKIDVKGMATFSDKDTAIKVGLGDIVTDGSMGSSQFMSGMSGYGWRLDATTNTLTIDNLIVRGVLNVFELAVNKISATNGSMWITDSFKIDLVHQIKFIENTTLANDEELNNLLMQFNEEDYFVVYSNSFNKTIIDLSQSTTHPFATRSEADPTVSVTQFDKFKYIFKIIDIDAFKALFDDYQNGLDTLCSESDLILHQANGIIRYNHMFLKEATREYEFIGERNPYDEDFENQLYTIVPTENASLDNGVYKFTSDSDIARINLYCKYFASNLQQGMNVYIIEAKHDEYPVFKPGDILKCQKFSGNSVKQYHALVLGLMDEYSYIIQLQSSSILQEGVRYNYNSSGELTSTSETLDTTLYNRSKGLNNLLNDYFNQAREILFEYLADQSSVTNDAVDWALQILLPVSVYEGIALPLEPETVADLLEQSVTIFSQEDWLNRPVLRKLLESSTEAKPIKDDALVRIGSIVYGDRRNSMYLTSSEQNSPYTDVLVGVNRPDYTVTYLTPKYVKIDGKYLQNSDFTRIMGLGYLNAAEQAVYNKYHSISTQTSAGWLCPILTNAYDVFEHEAELLGTTKVRMGNLNGIYNETFGNNQPNGFGLYGESVYLTGNFYLNNGKSLASIGDDVLFAVGSLNGENGLPAVLRLGQDYSLWALGSAGIMLINPNATYTNGVVSPSTVGDGDESILLQGNLIKFATNKTHIHNNTKYYEMICTTASPENWAYDGSIYVPKVSNSTVSFFRLYISQSDLSNINVFKKKISQTGTQNSSQYLKYLGFDNNFQVSNSPAECYLFNTYYEYIEPNDEQVTITLYSDLDNETVYSLSTTLYMVLRIEDSGEFENGHLRVKNLVAVESGYQNVNFDPELEITNANHPILGNDKSKPFAVVSGTTGKITAQGVDLNEATIGDSEGEHVRITDNKSTRVVNGNDGPAMYIRNKDKILAKFHGKDGGEPENIFPLPLGITFSYDTPLQGVSTSNNEIHVSASRLFDRKILTFKGLSLVNTETLAHFDLANNTTINNGFSTVISSVSNFEIKIPFRTSSLFATYPATISYLISLSNITNFTGQTFTVLSSNSNTLATINKGDYIFIKYQLEVTTESESLINSYNRLINPYSESETTLYSYNAFLNDFDNSTFIGSGNNGYLAYSDPNNHYIITRIKCSEFYITDPTNTHPILTLTYPYFNKNLISTKNIYDNHVASIYYEPKGLNYEINLKPSKSISLASDKLYKFNLSGIILDQINIKLYEYNTTGSPKSYSYNSTNGTYTTGTTYFRNETPGLSKYLHGEVVVKFQLAGNGIALVEKLYYLKNIISKIKDGDYYKPSISTELVNEFLNDQCSNILSTSGTINTFKLNIIISLTLAAYIELYKWKSINYNSSGLSASYIPPYETLPGLEPEITCYYPQNNTNYTWEPSKTPQLYYIDCQFDISNLKLTCEEVNYKTIVLGNGFISGLTSDNYFSTYFNNNLMKLSSKFGNLGKLYDGNSIYNLIGNNKIGEYFTILSGKITHNNSNLRVINNSNLPDIILNVKYYSFEGNSIISTNNVYDSTDTHGALFTTLYVFLQTPSYGQGGSVSGHVGSFVNYIESKDLYLISPYSYSVSENVNNFNVENTAKGKLIIAFGKSWNNIFYRYGYDINVNVTGAYTKTYGSSSFGNEGPLLVQLNSINEGDWDFTTYNHSSSDTNTVPVQVSYNNYILLDLYDCSGATAYGNFYITINYNPKMIAE